MLFEGLIFWNAVQHNIKIKLFIVKGQIYYGDLAAILPDFFKMLGIEQATLTSVYDLDPLYNLSEQVMACMPRQWEYLKTDPVILILKNFFNRCSAIQINDLSSVLKYAAFWKGLAEDVLRPLNKRKLEFIIQAGNAATRPSYWATVNLEIIHILSRYGKVRLIID